MSASPPAAAAVAASPSSSPPVAGASSQQLPLGTLQPGGVVSQRFVAETFHVKYEGVIIPMRDGVQLAGDLYLPAVEGRPDESQWSDAEGDVNGLMQLPCDSISPPAPLACALSLCPPTALQFPCVLIRTPYNKGAENPDLRSPGQQQDRAPRSSLKLLCH